MGLSINAEKTNTVISTRKYKASNRSKPKLDAVTLQLKQIIGIQCMQKDAGLHQGLIAFSSSLDLLGGIQTDTVSWGTGFGQQWSRKHFLKE